MHSDKDVARHRLLRKTLAVAASLITISSLAGCGFVNSNGGAAAGGSTSTPSGTVTVALSTEEAAAMKTLIPEFEKESGVTVKVTSAQTADLNQQLSVQLGSGTAPDIFRVSPGSSSAIGASLLGKAGKLAPLTDAGWAAKIPSSAKSLAQSGKDVYALPLSQNEIVMAYNESVFDKLGLSVPTTWSDFLDMCQKLKDAGITPISAGFSGGVFLQFLVYQLAASNVYAADPNIDAQQKGSSTAFSSSSAWKAVFEKFQTLQTKGYFTDGANGITGDVATQAVAEGKAGMISIVSASLASLASAATSSEIGVFALPGTDKASQTLLPVAPDFIAVNAQAKNKVAAKALLDFLAEPAHAKAYAKAAASLPGLSVGAAIPSQLEGVATFLQKGKTAPFANYTWPNGDTQQTLLQSCQDLISGKISVEELLEQLDAQFAKGTP
jgi:raffinose/stachyose/melibiose transport system substrate-binding protein